MTTTTRSHTVTFRLTTRFAIAFLVVSLMVLVAADATLRAYLWQRLDSDMAEDVKEMEFIYTTKGIEHLQTEFAREADSSGADAVFLTLVSPQGELLAHSDLRAWAGVPLPPDGCRDLSIGQTGFCTLAVTGHGDDTRVVCKQLADGNNLCLGHSTEEAAGLLAIYRDLLAVALGVMLVFGSLLGWWVARRAMSGVTKLTQTAMRLDRKNLAQRVVVGQDGREIEQLALAFNGMLERIETLVSELLEVTNNIAHDLRSPITRLRGMAETTLLAEPNADSYRELAATVIEESDRLVHLINTMLDIAETESGAAIVGQEPVDLAELLSRAHELYEPAARGSGIALTLSVPDQPLIVRGDAARLRRMVANLLDNAIKYTPAGGAVRLTATLTPSHAVLSVADSGTGIEAHDLPHIFERFYRADASRSLPGHGLGLSLCQAIVRAHGGEMTVTSESGKGATFRACLPLPTTPVAAMTGT